MSDRIYKVLDTYLSKGGVGVTISVSIAGDRIQTFSAGEADRGKKIAVRLTHLFRIGSCTKTFVSAAILHMADKGPEPDFSRALMPAGCCSGTREACPATSV